LVSERNNAEPLPDDVAAYLKYKKETPIHPIHKEIRSWA
jgi:hypothetical protein